jgi:hypothetical protein
MPVSFDDPEIFEEEIDAVSVPQSDLGTSDHRGRKSYRVEAKGVIGHVVAAAVGVHESEREYFEPSPLLD